MPNPKTGEDMQSYINRYMASEEAKRSFPDEKQRLAAAHSKWQQYKKDSVAKSIYTEEIAKQDFEEEYEKIHIDLDSNICKAVDEQQLVFGWANVAVKADGSLPFDWQGDIKKVQTLEKAAYDFVLKYRVANEVHEQNDEVRGDLVESVMFTKEKMAAMGIPEGSVPEGWWVGFHIRDPAVFEKIKTKKYRMFSIEGTGKRVPIDIP